MMSVSFLIFNIFLLFKTFTFELLKNFYDLFELVDVKKIYKHCSVLWVPKSYEFPKVKLFPFEENKWGKCEKDLFYILLPISEKKSVNVVKKVRKNMLENSFEIVSGLRNSGRNFFFFFLLDIVSGKKTVFRTILFC